jgi:hypothetical protein
MPKVKPFHGCFGRLERDALKTTGIHSKEWTRVRGRKTMGMNEKEISKFLASKALRDAKLIRDLAVAPKKTIPYLNPHDLFGNSKKSSQSKELRVKQLKKKAEKAKQKKTIIEPTMEMIEKEIQTNITDLRASENHVRNISKELEPHVRRSKGLIEIQRKLYDHLLELAVARTSGLQSSPLILTNTKNPKKVLQRLPLRDEEIEQFERILSGKEELEKLDNRFTDYLIYLDQIKNRRLELHRRNDHVDYTKFRYIGPGGILHTKPSGEPKLNAKYYKKVTSQRISAPRTVNMRSLNNVKRVKYMETIGRKNTQEKKAGGNHPEYQSKSERIALPTTSPRIKRFCRQVLDAQDKYYSAQKKVNQLTRELQLRTNRPEYQRRCQEIRKELCYKIDETVWKRKKYEQR